MTDDNPLATFNTSERFPHVTSSTNLLSVISVFLIPVSKEPSTSLCSVGYCNDEGGETLITLSA